jgi:hypothetical protein
MNAMLEMLIIPKTSKEGGIIDFSVSIAPNQAIERIDKNPRVFYPAHVNSTMMRPIKRQEKSDVVVL